MQIEKQPCICNPYFYFRVFVDGVIVIVEKPRSFYHCFFYFYYRYP